MHLQRYKEYNPTSWDTKGLNGSKFGISDWYVLVSCSRDASVLEKSNFEVCKKQLTEEFGEETTLCDSWTERKPNTLVWEGQLPCLSDIIGSNETHWACAGFNHWACGWYDLLLVEDTQAGEEFAACLLSHLEDYPVLSDDDYSQRESDAAWEFFKDSQYRDFINETVSDYEDRLPRICWIIDNFDADDVYEVVRNSNWEYDSDSCYHFPDGAFDIEDAVVHIQENPDKFRPILAQRPRD